MAVPPRPLTRAVLVEHALAIVDREGLEALTMRRLAADLGVRAPSLYNHVTGKDDLIAGVLTRVRAEMALPPDLPDDWMTVLGAIFGEYRRVLARHPRLVPLAGTRVDGGELSGLEYLTGQGFGTQDAVELWQTLTAMTVGFAMFASGAAASDTAGLPAAFLPDATIWRDETCDHAVRVVMASYEPRRRASADLVP